MFSSWMGNIPFVGNSLGKEKEKKHAKPTTPFEWPENVPDEVLLYLFSFCDVKTLLALRLVNTRLNNIYTSECKDRRKNGHQFFLNYLEHGLMLRSPKDVKENLERISDYLNLNVTADMHTGRKQARLAYLLNMIFEMMAFLTTQNIITFILEGPSYLQSRGNPIDSEMVKEIKEKVNSLFQHMVNPMVEMLSDEEYEQHTASVDPIILLAKMSLCGPVSDAKYRDASAEEVRMAIDPALLLAFSQVPFEVIQRQFGRAQLVRHEKWEDKANPEMISGIQNLAKMLQNIVLSVPEFTKEETSSDSRLDMMKKSLINSIGFYAKKDSGEDTAKREVLDTILRLMHKCTALILNRCIIRKELWMEFSKLEDKLTMRLPEMSGLQAVPKSGRRL